MPMSESGGTTNIRAPEMELEHFSFFRLPSWDRAQWPILEEGIPELAHINFANYSVRKFIENYLLKERHMKSNIVCKHLGHSSLTSLTSYVL